MAENNCKILANKIADGDFVDLMELLEYYPEDLTKKKAIYFIVCCCRTCYANLNSPANLDEKTIITCIKSLVKRLVDVTLEEFDKYLQSIYHICKFLLKKDCRLVLQLEQEIFPPFIPTTLTETQRGTYKSICQLLKLETINRYQNTEEIDKDALIAVGHFMSKILTTSKNYGIFTEIIFDFGSRIANLSIDINDQYKFFQSNLEIIERFNEADRSQGIMHFIKCGMFIFIAQIKIPAMNRAKSFISRLIEAIPKVGQCLVLKEILKICEFMQDLRCNLKELSDYKDNFLNIMKQYGNDDNVRSVFKATAQAVYWYSCYYKNCDNINENLELHLSFYEILQKIMAFLTYYSNICLVRCECSTLKAIPEGVYLVASIMNYFGAFVMKHEATLKSTKTVVSHVEKFSKFLVTLKKYKCEKWSNYWSELIRYVYNLAIQMYKKEKYEETLTICHMTLKYHSLLGNLDNNEDVILHTMSLMNASYLKQNVFTKALLWTSVEILNTNKTSRDKLFANIVKIKVAARDNNASSSVQELNVCTVLDIIPKEYECYLKNIRTRVELQVELLISELEIYDRKWKSKTPMLSAYRELHKIADNNVLMHVFVEIFWSWELYIHQDMEHILENVFENRITSTLDKYNVFVHYFRYKIQTQKIVTKNTAAMSKTVKAREASSQTIDLTGSDTLDKCDVVSVYEGLRIDGEKMDSLKECLNELEQLVENKVPDVDLEKLYTISNNVAFEFSLHSDVYNFLKALYLGLEIAKRLEDNEYILECNGFIIKHTCSGELEKKMKKIIQKIDPKSEYLIQYYVNLSYGHLYRNNINDALKCLNSAVKCLNLRKKLWHVETEIELLKYEIMQVNVGGEFSYKPLLMAYDIILDKFTTEPEWKPKHFELFFKVSGTLIKTYHDLRMLREVRFYGTQMLHLTQQYSIPVGSTKVLNYLAHADYRNERWDDFRVKLDGISQILLLDKGIKGNQLKHVVCRDEKPVLPTINVITEGIRDVNLNNGDFTIKLSSSSPSFIGETYQQPAFWYHENCECFQCTSLEYHELVLARSHLEALWYTHLKHATLADSFFKGTLNFSRILSKKQLVLPGNLRGIIKIPKQLEHNSIKRYYYSCSVDYVKFLYVCVTPEAAEEHNKNLLEQVVHQKNNHRNVYAEVLLQRLKFLHKVKQIKTELSQPQLPMCKTPETRPKIVKIATNSPKIKTFYAPKIIKFDLDEENKQTPVAKTPKLKTLPPSLRNARTPLLKTPKEPRLPLVELVDKAKDVKIKDNLLDLKPEKLDVKTMKKTTSTRKKLDLNAARIEDDRSKRATRRNRT